MVRADGSRSSTASPSCRRRITLAASNECNIDRYRDIRVKATLVRLRVPSGYGPTPPESTRYFHVVEKEMWIRSCLQREKAFISIQA